MENPLPKFEHWQKIEGGFLLMIKVPRILIAIGIGLAGISEKFQNGG